MENYRIAIMVPSVEFGAYWQPVLIELKKIFKNLVFYTGCLWPGFDPQSSGAEIIETVGKTTFLEANKVSSGYGRGFIMASPEIVKPLLKYKPHLLFASAFSIWTVLAILLKPIGGWKLVIIYDGSSPNTNFQDSKFRSILRRWMVKFTDGFVANSESGKVYLEESLNANPEKIFVRTYLVPDDKALREKAEGLERLNLNSKKPVFLYVGQVISRKGITALLEACKLLKQQGYQDYSLVIVGDGAQRSELEKFVQDNGLTEQITWTGWVEYGKLGTYFQAADIFVFPTYEDVWGMVVLEAMNFGKPVLCSKWANAVEVMEDGGNGYIFDPFQPQEIAEAMKRLIEHPELIQKMGIKSQALITQYTPKTAALDFAEVAEKILEKPRK